jgi:hypothetical protein
MIMGRTKTRPPAHLLFEQHDLGVALALIGVTAMRSELVVQQHHVARHPGEGNLTPFHLGMHPQEILFGQGIAIAESGGIRLVEIVGIGRVDAPDALLAESDCRRHSSAGAIRARSSPSPPRRDLLFQTNIAS